MADIEMSLWVINSGTVIIVAVLLFEKIVVIRGRLKAP